MRNWSESAFERSPVASALLARDAAGRMRITRASASLARLVGSDALVGRELDGLVPADRRLVRHEAALEDGTTLVQLIDVSPFEETERSLRGAVRRLEDIIDNCAALVYVKDTEGRYSLVNRQFEQRFGFDRAQVIGRTDFEIFPYEAAAAYVEHDGQVLATAQAMQVEEPRTPEPIEVEEPDLEVDGSWLSIKFALLDEAGRPYAMAGISTDITDRKRAEAALREARDEAERANRAKSEFLSRMSHELRTPLNAILGFGQLLELERLRGDAATSVERIMKAGRHLLTLINEVLEITRIEAGAYRLSVEPVHACEPLQEALELVRPLARERGIELASDLHGGLHHFVLADHQRLKQVLLNLLANAIKYNRPDGAVRVFFREHEGRLRCLVSDTGPGLRADEVERALLPFERLAAERTDTEGTGLGLALSKSLAEAMGGRLGVQHSAPGEGSTFFVELPLTDPVDRGPREPAPALDGVRLPRATILYVEDDVANLELVQRILDRSGEVELIPAMQGALGLELALQHRPDLVLLDLHLPDMTGAELLRRLKRDARTRAIPVVVLSADATPARIDDLRGVADYVTKPIDIGRFVAALRTALERR